MDSDDIEMVVRAGDEVGPAHDMNLVTATESKLSRQNRCFTVAMMASLVAILFFIGNLDQAEDAVEMISSYGNDGTISQVDGEAVAAGAQQIQLNDHNKPKPHLVNHTSADAGSTEDDGNDPDVQAWLNASVTLRDGVKYKVVKQISHDKTSFTEGLTFCDNQLYESVGMRRNSALLVLDIETGATLEKYLMDSQYFAEGLTCVGDRLIQLTYTKRTGFIYDRTNLQSAPEVFSYDTTTGEGWGLTYDSDRHELVVSDGSEFLRTYLQLLMDIGTVMAS